MSEVEKLHFKIGLSGTYWAKRPIYSILVNDQVKETCEITTASDEVFFVEFDCEVSEGPCTLKIRLENKENPDTVTDDTTEEFVILKDMLLNIESVEIDEIDLGSLKWTLSDYQPVYPERYKAEVFRRGDTLPDSVKNCVNLGWNGKWVLPFTSPFYIWLLENI
jgi:hypothetical protein